MPKCGRLLTAVRAKPLRFSPCGRPDGQLWCNTRGNLPEIDAGCRRGLAVRDCTPKKSLIDRDHPRNHTGEDVMIALLTPRNLLVGPGFDCAGGSCRRARGDATR